MVPDGNDSTNALYYTNHRDLQVSSLMGFCHNIKHIPKQIRIRKFVFMLPLPPYERVGQLSHITVPEGQKWPQRHCPLRDIAPLMYGP